MTRIPLPAGSNQTQTLGDKLDMSTAEIGPDILLPESLVCILVNTGEISEEVTDINPIAVDGGNRP